VNGGAASTANEALAAVFAGWVVVHAVAYTRWWWGLARRSRRVTTGSQPRGSTSLAPGLGAPQERSGEALR
jgi:hypothetical protein